MANRRSDDGKLYAQIASSLRGMIEDGTLVPGDKLPALAELAVQFGCSRATVREALGSLRGQGLIEVRHGDGTYVRTASVEMWMEPLDAAILLGEGESVQLAEFMTALLAGVVGVAAQRHYRLDLTPLNRALFELECVEQPSEEAIAAEIAFYVTLAEVAGNQLFENAFRILQEALRSSLRVFQEAGGFRQSLMGVEVSRQIFDAVQAGNDVGAREIVYRYGEKLSTQLAALRMRRSNR